MMSTGYTKRVTPAGLGIELLHHVTLTTRNLERSLAFYRDVMGLEEIERPAFPFPGAWFRIEAAQQLHLVVHDDATYRATAEIDTHDVHFAIRVRDYDSAVTFLRNQGYRETSEGGERLMKLQPRGKAGFPQIYILDPDRHVIEINAARL